MNRWTSALSRWFDQVTRWPGDLIRCQSDGQHQFTIQQEANRWSPPGGHWPEQDVTWASPGGGRARGWASLSSRPSSGPWGSSGAQRPLKKINIGLEQGFGETYNTYIWRILGDQFGQDDSTIHLQEKRLLLFFISFFGESVVCAIRRCFSCLVSLDWPWPWFLFTNLGIEFRGKFETTGWALGVVQIWSLWQCRGGRGGRRRHAARSRSTTDLKVGFGSWPSLMAISGSRFLNLNFQVDWWVGELFFFFLGGGGVGWGTWPSKGGGAVLSVPINQLCKRLSVQVWKLTYLRLSSNSTRTLRTRTLSSFTSLSSKQIVELFKNWWKYFQELISLSRQPHHMFLWFNQ